MLPAAAVACPSALHPPEPCKDSTSPLHAVPVGALRDLLHPDIHDAERIREATGLPCSFSLTHSSNDARHRVRDQRLVVPFVTLFLVLTPAVSDPGPSPRQVIE